MNQVQRVAKLVRLMSNYGYRHTANKYAAIHALNSASLYMGNERKRVVEDVLTDLVAAKAVFDVSSTYRICLEALKAVDNAAKIGVELSVHDALNDAMESNNA